MHPTTTRTEHDMSELADACTCRSGSPCLSCLNHAAAVMNEKMHTVDMGGDMHRAYSVALSAIQNERLRADADEHRGFGGADPGAGITEPAHGDSPEDAEDRANGYGPTRPL